MAFHRIGFALTGSFCTHRDALAVMEELAADHELVPILSEHAGSWDTRFGTAEDLRRRVAKIAGREPVTTVAEAERFGPADPLDALILCPCTGNTLAKLARGITDTTVTMAAKAHLRSDRPLLIAPASNDAMSANLSPRDGGARDADEAPVSVSGLRADEKARVLIRKRASGETRAVQDGS